MDGSDTSLMSCDSEGIVKRWDKRTMKCMGTVDCGPHAVNGLDFERSGKIAAVASEDFSMKMIDVENMKSDIFMISIYLVIYL